MLTPRAPPRVPLRVPCMSEMLTACTAHPEQPVTPRGVYRPSWPLASLLLVSAMFDVRAGAEVKKGEGGFGSPISSAPLVFLGFSEVMAESGTSPCGP